MTPTNLRADPLIDIRASSHLESFTLLPTKAVIGGVTVTGLSLEKSFQARLARHSPGRGPHAVGDLHVLAWSRGLGGCHVATCTVWGRPDVEFRFVRTNPGEGGFDLGIGGGVNEDE